MPLEMVSCGKCKRCLAGGRVHGPYPYRWQGSGESRRHLYGGGEDSLELQRLRGVDEAGEEEVRRIREEVKRLREEAERDAEERERRLTEAQRQKRDGIMSLLARLRSVTRRERLAREDEEGREPGQNSDGKKSGKKKPGLIERGMKELAKQTAQQLRQEAKDIRRQIKHEKTELQKMLGQSRR